MQAEHRPLVALIGATLPTDLRVERQTLANIGADVVDGRRLDDGALADLLARADGVLSEGFFDFDFDAMPRCRGLSLYSIGIDQVDLAAAAAAGIVVTNVPGYCAAEVADHTMALLLALWRKLPAASAIALSDDWRIDALRPIRRLGDSSLGLVGLGAIARGVARRARAFGLAVVAHDAYVDPSAARALGVPLMSLDAMLSSCNAISVHVPLSDETAGLIGAREIALMRERAILVCTSRGGVVDAQALLDALDAGRIAGAGLDVLATEPPQDPCSRRLAAHKQVICSPHMAYYSEQALVDLRRGAAEALAAVLIGRPHDSIVNQPTGSGGIQSEPRD